MPTPPPPPRWRIWLLLVGALVTLVLLFGPSTSTSKTHSFTYSDFVTQVTGDKVKTATIDQNGKVSGKLSNGDGYTSQVPVAIRDDSLAPLLAQHHVQVKAITSSGTTLGVIILDLLPFVLFLGFFIWMGRRASKQLSGGMGGMGGLGGTMGVGRSKAKVYDLDDRPKTRFADVAGYDGVKQEISEVVDFLAADFMAARDRVLLGHRDATNALLPAEKYAVAVHEGGHALVAALSEHADPVAKVTILPAGQALGVTEQLPEAERHLYPESYLSDSLKVRMGGRAGEMLVLHEASTGASNDLAPPSWRRGWSGTGG